MPAGLLSAQLSNGDMVYSGANGSLKQVKRPVNPGIYLFIGQDIQAKEKQFKKIKQEFLPSGLQDFNSDTLYAKEIILKDIQERLLAIPVKSAKRIVVIKDAHFLDEKSRDFLLVYAQKPHQQLILVLDFQQYNHKDEFVRGMSAYASVLRFEETIPPNTFALARQIELRKTDFAMRILNQLLKEGQAPERILGGLRFAWEKQDTRSQADRRKLLLLLNCDIEIKTGRLRPAFALEKLVVNLCGFV